ncbi:MAG TPA: MaoC family dehydratase N-terminal domain-containing protein [Gemmatimonadaceae bacterium]
MEVEKARGEEHDWKRWIGLAHVSADWITPSRVAAWHATLDHASAPPRDGDLAPLGFHWTLAPQLARESELGPDGHPARGTFLPPIPLPRRLWAGSRVSFDRALRVGDRVERESVITAIEEKQGRSSALVFVTVQHRFTTDDGVAIREDQDLVYREPATSSGPATEVANDASGSVGATWQRTIHPTETLLFRYSALTFNGHRIHYDRRYATEVEGYPGLVVHGPLIATLLLDLIQTRVAAERVERFQFRAMRPTFDTSDFSVFGGPGTGDGNYRLWSTDNSAARAVEAEAWTRR